VRRPTQTRVAGGSRPRRSSSPSPLRFINRWRVCGLLLAAAAATWAAWFLTSERFDLDPANVAITELVYTEPDVIRTRINLPEDAAPNVFRIGTRDMQRALESLPAVASADVHVDLPSSLVVDVTERMPTFVLISGDTAYVVDRDGHVLDGVERGGAAELGLPIVLDNRVDFAPELEVGGVLDQVSLDADLRLAALTPEIVGTTYNHLRLSVNDTEGYVLEAEPNGWRAVFGQYTPNLRPVDIVDRQVQCLRARVAEEEQQIAVIYLAPLDEGCGTYLPRTTQAPVESASPAASR
jgi:cell division septal protein FtsQ